jgi:hypothetical protein
VSHVLDEAFLHAWLGGVSLPGVLEVSVVRVRLHWRLRVLDSQRTGASSAFDVLCIVTSHVDVGFVVLVLLVLKSSLWILVDLFSLVAMGRGRY